MKTFRLLVHPPASGPWNMAVDEAILDSIGLGESLPTVRLYAWDPPCLSLGYSQSIHDVDQDRLSEKGWGLVRRMTGGRAILHADELTYSLIAPHNNSLVAGSLLESYHKIARGLLKALHFLGISGEINQDSQNMDSNHSGPVCFEVPSPYEITYQGKKLIGSAQARRKQGILQHGSLPLFGDLGRIIEVLAFVNERIRRETLKRLMDHATNVEMITGSCLDWELAAGAFQKSFQTEMDLDLLPGKLTSKEKEIIPELIRTKYSNPDWTDRI
ncbi:biotin/lipoate A/B protein ligase family protein [Chloroflexota bacterium]